MGRAGRPKGRNRKMHTEQALLRQWAWESKLGKRGRTYKEKSELPEKNSGENQGEVERSTHGPGIPVHTASAEEEHITTPVSDMTTFISKFAGSRAWYPKGF